MILHGPQSKAAGHTSIFQKEFPSKREKVISGGLNMAAPVQKNQALFESMPIPQAVRQMAVPAVLSQIVVLLYNLADTFFIGKTKKLEDSVL